MPSSFCLDFVYPSLKKDTENLIQTHFAKEGKLSYRVYDNCYAAPAHSLLNANGEHCLGGGLIHNGEWVYNSGLNLHSLTPYEFDYKNVEYIDEEVIYIGIISSVWGHAITDGLQHLWWFLTKDYLDNHRDKTIYYWGEHPLSGNYLELLRLIGIDVSRLKFITRTILFKSVIVPDSSFVSNYPTGTHYFYEYVNTIDHIIAHCKFRPNSEKKVFISELSNSRNWGIKSIEKIAKKNGYKIIHPADLSLLEMIFILQGADDVMTFESSVGHNVVFCKPKTKIAILRKANYVNSYQSVINQIRDFDITIIDVHLSLMNNERFPYAGPFFVYANSNFCRYLNVQASPFPLSLLMKYFRYNLLDGEQSLNAKLCVPKNYIQILSNELDKSFNHFSQEYSRSVSFLPLPDSIKKELLGN